MTALPHTVCEIICYCGNCADRLYSDFYYRNMLPDARWRYPQSAGTYAPIRCPQAPGKLCSQRRALARAQAAGKRERLAADAKCRGGACRAGLLHFTHRGLDHPERRRDTQGYRRWGQHARVANAHCIDRRAIVQAQVSLTTYL
jgi:hypothetical protein